MPLLPGSTNDIISSNVKELRNAGHPENQAVAAALRIAQGKKHSNRHKNLGNYLHPKKAVGVPLQTATKGPDVPPLDETQTQNVV